MTAEKKKGKYVYYRCTGFRVGTPTCARNSLRTCWAA